MAVNDIFRKVPVEIPNKSGFDENHSHTFTAKVGTLVPAMTDLLLPNDTISLGVASEIQLPPMATDFYGRVKGHFEAFFVPLRNLYGGWQELITVPDSGPYAAPTSSVRQRARFLPTLRIDAKDMGPGSLSDYLGYGFDTVPSSVQASTLIDVLNPLKYAAYHKIWDCWYRDSRIQKPAFEKGYYSNGGIVAGTTPIFSELPYFTSFGNSPEVITDVGQAGPVYPLMCADNVPCYSLRQRNFGRDYFTNATPLPQAGQPAAVAFQTDAQGNGAFTIASLRAANAIQTWMERQNIAGFRYGDQIKANFGVYPSDAALDRPLYLGRQIVDVYNKSVYQQGNEASAATNNPFSSVASKFGSPLGVGEGSLVDNFTATEHGYIFVMFSLVPEVLYSGVMEKDMDYNKMSDFPFPLLAGVGDEPVTAKELVGYYGYNQTTLDAMKAQVFGYTQRYANHKFKLDRVSGLLKDNNSLESFALQRMAANPGQSISSVQISSSFIEIPTNYLDNVSAVQGDVSKYGCWVDANFPYKKISTLPAYSIPTLGDIKNTHTEVIDNGGKRL